MRYSLVIILLMLMWVPVVSMAKEFTCTIQCKDQTGNLRKVTVLIDALSRVKAESKLTGFIDLNSSKAAEICKSKGYKGLLIQKGERAVNCH